MQCIQQGKCLGWEGNVPEQKWNRSVFWSREPACLNFLIKSIYNMLPSPVNLVRWKISNDSKCKCGQYCTLQNILIFSLVELKKRYTRRRKQILRQFLIFLGGKFTVSMTEKYLQDR